MQQDVITVSSDRLVGEVARIRVEGFRFVTMTCVALEDEIFHIHYHFDRDFMLKHLRLATSMGSSVPSISPVYVAAFLVENEIQDLFGIRFESLVIDYDRTLYLDGGVMVTPFCKYSVNGPDRDTPVARPTVPGT
jgi:ech hydrogenase subunit D